MNKNSEKSEAVLKGLIDFIEGSKDGELLENVTDGLEKEVEKKKGVNEIIVTSPVKLTAPQLAKIREIMAKRLKADFPAVNRVDPRLLGGFTVKVNDWFLDSSLKKEVKNFKRMLLES